MTGILLIHGGLWEPMNAERFWVHTGVTAALSHHGFDVIAPDRLQQPASWQADADQLRQHIPEESFVLIGASNGCSVAALLALEYGPQVARLVLAWPATAGVPNDHVPQQMLTGDVLRGLSRAELHRILVPTGIVPSDPENPQHQRRTVDDLLATIPHVRELPGSPEPPRPGFQAQQFLDSVMPFLTGAHPGQ